jgi:phosphatidylinositol-3-phosphatase
LGRKRAGMLRLRRTLICAAVCLAAAVSLVGAPSANARVHRFRHVWVFVMENHSLRQILGNPNAPFLNRMARRYRVATRFYAVRHPSLPNYLAMISGSTQGCRSDDCRPGYRGTTLARELSRHGLRWQGYFQGLPRRGYTGDDRGNYVRHHNPFVYFRSVTSRARQRRHIRRLRALPRSLSRPPAFSFIVPNNAHNMHSSSVATGDRWLAHWVRRVKRSPGYDHGGVIFIIWDEGHNDTTGCCLPGVHGGRIPLFIISHRSRLRHRLRRPTTTYSFLRTIEAGFRLPRLGLAARSRPLPPPI